MGVYITTTAYLRVLTIEIGSTIILMVVEAQGGPIDFLPDPWVPASWQELGHGPFDGPFSFFPGMAMSIAGRGGWCGVCVFFCSRRRCSTGS